MSRSYFSTDPDLVESYRLRMHAYCGTYYDIGDPFDSRDAARTAMVQRAARFRRLGHPCTRHGADRVEIETPDNASMIGDGEGLLCVEPIGVEVVDCWICGCAVRIGSLCCEPDEDIGADEGHEDDEDDEDDTEGGIC